MEQSAQRRVPIESQRVDAPLTSSAVLLTLTLTDPAAGSEAVRIVRGVLAGRGHKNDVQPQQSL